MRGIVSAGDQRTAEAGARVLRMGGNAYDAVTACVFAACVAEPALTSPAGGGFLLSSSPGEAPRFHDFFVDVPPDRAGEAKDFYPVDVDFGSTIQAFHIGAAACATPGVVKGLLSLQASHGRLPLEATLAPAIELARAGVVLTQFQRYVVEILAPIFLATPEARALYAPSGALISEGERFCNPELADFLEALAVEGAPLFYEGAIADQIHAVVAPGGGVHKADLARYTVHTHDPIRFRFGDLEIVTSAPPSLSGLLMRFTLGLLEGRLEGVEWGGHDHLGRIIDAFAATQAFREQDFRRHVAEDNRGYDLDEATIRGYIRAYTAGPNPFGNTTHISVIDAEQNAVSCTSSNGEGCGIMVPGTGIMLNNMLGEADLNPKGFFQWPDYARLPSMMAPTMIFRGGEPYMLLGSSGSNRIRSAILLTLLNYTVFGQPITDAVRAPRVHYEDGVVYLEPGFAPEVVEALRREHEVVAFDAQNLFFGGVQAATYDLQGCADRRRGGWMEIV